MRSLSVEVVSDIRTLVTVEPAWWSLWHRARAATPFQSPAWLIPWWQAFAPGELFVVVAWRDARLLGMAPLYVESGRGGDRLLPLGVSISDYLDVLVDAAWEEEVLGAMSAFLATCPTPWATLDLPDVSADGLALRLPTPTGCEDEVARSTPCPVLALLNPGDSLERAVPARKRRDVRMAWHRAERRGAVVIERIDPSSADDAVEDLFRLHRARWRSRGEPGVLADPRLRAFHGTAVPKLVHVGIARMHRLSIGGAVAGIYYGMAHAGLSYAYLCGFDPAFEYESPGTTLIGHAIEEAMREGATEFHFLRGGEGYKYQWGAVDRWNCRRVIVRRMSHARAS